MENSGNFLKFAAGCGYDVGYGKLLIIYGTPDKIVKSKTTAELNTQIDSNTGNILGVIRGWHTVAGASVAETNVERTATGEISQIRGEIAADTLTFEATLQNRVILKELCKGGTFDCILIDDQPNAYGEKVIDDETRIGTMKINFSGFTSTNFQRDRVTDKSISVTARYLVKDLIVAQTAIEPELVTSKTLLDGVLVNTYTEVTLEGDLSVSLILTEKNTGKKFIGDITDMEVTATGFAILSATIEPSVTIGDGGYTITIIPSDTANGVTLPVTVDIALSGIDSFMRTTRFYCTDPA